MYSPVHRREFRERMLEITLWDQARVREEESEFLGEVRTTKYITSSSVDILNLFHYINQSSEVKKIILYKLRLSALLYLCSSLCVIVVVLK